MLYIDGSGVGWVENGVRIMEVVTSWTDAYHVRILVRVRHTHLCHFDVQVLR